MTISIEEFIKDKDPLITAVLDESLMAVVQRMSAHDFSHMPVVDEENRPVGVITSDQVLSFLSDGTSPINDLQIEQIMTYNLSLFAQSGDLMALFEQAGDGYTLVTDEDGLLVQIITRSDVMIYLKQLHYNMVELFANMNPELNTSLSSIKMLSEVLLANIYGELNEQMEEVVRLIHENGQQLSNVINDWKQDFNILLGRDI